MDSDLFCNTFPPNIIGESYLSALHYLSQHLDNSIMVISKNTEILIPCLLLQLFRSNSKLPFYWKEEKNFWNITTIVENLKKELTSENLDCYDVVVVLILGGTVFTDYMNGKTHLVCLKKFLKNQSEIQKLTQNTGDSKYKEIIKDSYLNFLKLLFKNEVLPAETMEKMFLRAQGTFK